MDDIEHPAGHSSHEPKVLRITGTVVFALTDIKFVQATAFANLITNPEVEPAEVAAIGERVLQQPLYAIEQAFNLRQFAVELAGVEVLYTEQFTEEITDLDARVSLFPPGGPSEGIAW